MRGRDIIGIGASMGGIEAVRLLLSKLPSDQTATLFVVIHVGALGQNRLADIFNKESALPVSTAQEGEAVRAGRVYVAPADKHLLVLDDIIHLGHGPRENMARPAIDPLFRSLGTSYGPRAIGVVLTGMLNDGAAGLADLKRCAGTTVVQNPLDATASEMPTRALEVVDVDYRAPLGDLPELLVKLSREHPAAPVAIHDDIYTEIEIALGRASDVTARIAAVTPLTCPDCGGVLSQIKRPPLRFRCQVGHAYTAEALSAATNDGPDSALRMALRVLLERTLLAEKMSDDAKRGGRLSAAASFDKRANEFKIQIDLLQRAIAKAGTDERGGSHAKTEASVTEP
jgi:two-component system, chemotaxis family, protein-glutamate methylesterase/glutaminase